MQAESAAPQALNLTGLPFETLRAVGEELTRVQPRMAHHAAVTALLKKRRGMVEGLDSRVDFAFGELLAFGTLSLRRPRGVCQPCWLLLRASCVTSSLLVSCSPLAR